MSIWPETSELPRFQSLKKDTKTDVLIIGGGLAGLLCAYMLQKAGISCVLTEAERICGGATKNTTAKITLQHRLIYHKLLNHLGPEKAKMYLEANCAALKEYQALCRTINCDYEEKDSFVYSLYDRELIEKELKALDQLGFPGEFVKDLPLPFPVAGAVKIKNQAQFHPLKFASAIARELNIYENTWVRELAPHTAVTDGGKITADKIIAATHFPMNNKHGSYFLKMYQDRSYVIGLKNAGNVKGIYIDQDEKGLSFRNYKDLLLMGGGGHRTGKTGGGWSKLDAWAAEYYPGSIKSYQWAAQDCITLDGIPYIGQYSKRTPDFYVATGFNKWGMTSSMAAAIILRDMIAGNENPFASVFSPSRSMLHLQLGVNIFEAVTNFLTPSAKRCPHMGCALKWNPQENSWDCPCHGSRFTEKGDLIDNPSSRGLNEEKHSCH